MTNESRTSKSIKNAQVSLFYYVVQLILGFFSRKVFFDYLGSEVLGLNTTASNLLGFLNLAELGIGMSVGYFLYKPLYDGDTMRLNKIIALQGWVYRRIAIAIILAACVLMGFFPWIFAKSDLPLWYAYVTFGVLLFGAMLGYFVNYRQILLQADQKNYKVQRITQGAIVVKTIVQIVGMQIVPWPFIFWTSTEFLFTVFSAWALDHVLKKEYPWLKTSGYSGKELLKEFPEIIVKTKQVFVHKFACVVLSQCAPLIMYGFSSLTIVAFYGNYQLILGKVSYLLQTVFNSTGAGIGNLIASKDKKRILSVFWELFDSRLCISMSILFAIYFVVQQFITLWLGEQYLLSDHMTLLILITSAISINQATVYSYLGGFGLYSDVWAALAETLLNVSGSILCGYLFGFEGVLIGGIFSQIIIVCLWKPYFLFTKGMMLKAREYFVPVLYRLLLIAADFIVIDLILTHWSIVNSNNFILWGLTSLAVLVCISAIMFAQFYLLTQGMRDFSQRMLHIILKK